MTTQLVAAHDGAVPCRCCKLMSEGASMHNSCLLRSLHVVVVALFLLFDRASALATGSFRRSVSVTPVDSDADVRSLADLRYDEWIADKYPDTSRSGFRMATAELHQERRDGGATSFLARIEKVVAGAAELSPIELKGAVRDNGYNNHYFYITDVVTAHDYRRRGVAQALMQAMEDVAIERGSDYILLHVEESNTAALAFYRTKLDYDEPPDEVLAVLDAERLARNAGTQGQILLGKAVIPAKQSRGRGKKQAGIGFGVKAKARKKRTR